MSVTWYSLTFFVLCIFSLTVTGFLLYFLRTAKCGSSIEPQRLHFEPHTLWQDVATKKVYELITEANIRGFHLEPGPYVVYKDSRNILYAAPHDVWVERMKLHKV